MRCQVTRGEGRTAVLVCAPERVIAPNVRLRAHFYAWCLRVVYIDPLWKSECRQAQHPVLEVINADDLREDGQREVRQSAGDRGRPWALN